MRAVRGTASTVSWSADGRSVEKRFDRRWRVLDGARHDPFTREWRVGELFRRARPPVPTPRLLRVDHRRRSLVFEAVDGAPVGEKYPGGLAAADVAGLVGLAGATERFPARARFLKRFDLERRLRAAVAAGLLGAAEAASLRRLAAEDPPELVFAHGDLTARNVLRRAGDGGLVVVDWEWAGRYPAGWELAFLWFTLVDVEGARALVEAAVADWAVAAAGRERWFWRSALLVHVLHLGLPGLAAGSPFRARHLAMRDQLVERVLG